jgi:hypothetical protein
MANDEYDVSLEWNRGPRLALQFCRVLTLSFASFSSKVNPLLLVNQRLGTSQLILRTNQWC